VADRIYKGRILVTGAVAKSNRAAFTEASEDLNKPHAGGLVPFEMLKEILGAEEIQGSLWKHKDDTWVKIDPDGHIEIGLAGA